MKKFWLKAVAIVISLCLVLSVNVYAYDYPTYDVTLNSGDVVEAYQYSEQRFNGEYDPEFKCVKTVTINALGEEPIVIKRSAFSGSVTRQVESLIINGTGKIILSSFAFCYTGITDIDIPSNVIFENGAECVFGSSFLRRATIRSDLCPAMFQECWSLIYVNFLNQNIKKIPVDCFDTCGLLSITIPSSVTEIEDGAFHSTFYLERVNLNEGLESIGNNSFESSNSIKELKFPSTLKSIGEKSFYDNSSLVKLELNDGLETIGESAFRGCRSLKSVTIPASVTSIGEKAFGYSYDSKTIDGFTIYGYRGTAAEAYANENGIIFIPLDSTDLNDIDVVLNSGDVVEAGQYSEPDEYAPDYKAVGTVTFNATGSKPITVNRLGFSGNSSSSNNVKNIIFNGNGEIILDSLAFSCSCVTTLYLPSNVHFADNAEYVFDGAKNLKKAIVACKLCPNMFSESKELREVEISQGNNLEELPDGAFYLCSSLEKINFPSTLKRIGASCFYYSNLSDIKLNEGLETIDEYAFYFATDCNSIEFPSTLKSIGKSAFLGCPFNSIKLNDGLSSIGEKAFYGNNFKSVTVPISVTSIGEKAFGYISDSEKIDGFTIYGYRGTAAETYANENGFTFIPLDLVEFERFEDTTSSSPVYDVTVHSGAVVEERQYAELYEEWSEDHYWINKLTFDARGVAPITINDYGFAGANGAPGYIRTIDFIGSGDVVLGSQTFNFTGIESLTLPANVKFKDNAEGIFTSCLRLKTADIYCDVVPKMFDDCNSLETVNFKGNTTSIPYAAFRNCNIKRLDIPASVKSIGEEAFFGSYQLAAVTLRSGLSSIGAKAFYDNDFKFVIIPASVTSIGEKAFGYISDSKTIDGFTIYGYRRTAAETYANENGFTFIPLDTESSVNGVTYTPSWSSVNDYSFSVDGRPLKLQVIEATGATRTFSRHASNVVIKAYDGQGNEVHDTSADLAYEVWTVKTRLTPNSNLKIHAKYGNVWEDQMYGFSISTLYSDTTLKSAELAETSGKQSAVDCKIVTGSGVNKVRIEYEDGMTSTVNSSMAVLDKTNMTYTYSLSVKPRHIGKNSFKVYIKTPTYGWSYETTLTYTVE